MAVVDLFTCMFIMACVFYMLESPGIDMGSVPPTEGVLIRTGRPALLHIRVTTAHRTIHSWADVAGIRRLADESLAFFPRPGEALLKVQLIADPGSHASTVEVQLEGGACGVSKHTLDASTHFRRTISC
ncbi:hypothetical protein [Aquimonas sp.]|uniref:hypothetical protein n=1 Tax=Aquimonas sp. TaxID=1872588 RepID=UPI0037C199FA